jgi:hypothetical protein
MLDLRIDRVSGTNEDALYNIYEEKRLVYANVTMDEVMRYLHNIQEDNADE